MSRSQRRSCHPCVPRGTASQWQFFGGALYLFLINAIFIALSTYAIVRVLKYSPVVQVERKTHLRVKRLMWAIIIITILPSVFIAFRLIDKSVFEGNVARFVEAEFRFEGTAVLEAESTYSLSRKGGQRSLTLMLLGEPLHETTIENIRGKMPFYDLGETSLTINQAGGGGATQLDFAPLQQGYAQVLEEKNSQIAELRRQLSLSTHIDSAGAAQAMEEFRAIAPDVERVSISRHPVWTADGQTQDTMLVCILHPATGEFSSDERERIERGLRVKHKTDNVRIYVE